MNSAIRALILFATGVFFAGQCNADNGTTHSSKINGVSLFWMFLSADTPPNDIFEERDGKDLVEHCNGNNVLHIHELASKGFTCESVKSGLNSHRISILGVNKTDELKAPHLLPDHQGIYTISKTPLPSQNWKIEPLSEEAIIRLQAMAKNQFKCPSDHPCQILSGKQFDRSFQLYEGQVRTAELEKLAIAIRGSATDLLIAPIAVELVGDVDGGTAVFDSAVFSKTGNTEKYVGILSGSLIRVGADIDGDGVPEIIVDNSVETTQMINYHKIHPFIDALVSYKHW
jgi:hypothetical protein